MSDRELRDILARVVPEPPSEPVSASAVRDAGRRARRRLTVVTVAAASIAVIGAVAVPAWIGGDRQDSSSDPAPRQPTACAADPEVEQIAKQTSLPDGELVSARLCEVPLSPDQGPLANAAPADVLTGRNLQDFLEKITAVVPAAVQPECPGATEVLSYFQFERRDGSLGRLRVPTCARTQYAFTPEAAQQLLDSFLAAADAQRAASEPPLVGDVAPSTCDQRTMMNPARPGRERLTAAIYCETDKSRPRRLTRAQLAVLQAAWESAKRTNLAIFDCATGMAPGFIVATDDWGDRLAFLSDFCAGYWLYPHQGYSDATGELWHLPVTAGQRRVLGVAR